MMENLLLALKSVTDTWLSPSLTPWVTDIILGILCGLVLFLILLALFDREPSSPPSRTHRNIRKHPVEQRKKSRKSSKTKAKRVCRDCLHDVHEARGVISLLQSHLGRLPDKDNNIRQSSMQNPPGEVCKAEPDGAHQPCEEEPAEDAAPVMAPSASPAPLTPSPLPLASAPSAEHPEGQSDTHTRPLDTTVKTSTPGNSFSAPPITAISDFAHSSCPTKFLSRWWMTTKAVFSPTSLQIQTQTHPSFSLPIQSPSSQPLVLAPGVSCPKSRDKSLSFFATEIPGLEWPLVQRQPKRDRAALPSAASRSQEAFSQLTPNLSRDKRASRGRKSVCFVSPNPQKQQLRRRLLKDEQQNGRCIRVQVSLDLMQAQGKSPGVCQTRDKQGPLRPSVFPGEISQDLQKMKSRYARRCRRKDGLTFQQREDLTRGPQQCLSRILEDTSGGSASFPLKVLAMNPKRDSERELTRPSNTDSGSSLCKGPNKEHREQILRLHLGRKLEQVNQGLIPVSVRRSWVSANHDFPKRHAHTETRNVASLKGRESCINTSCELSTLSPRIQQLLEAHVIRLRVRHKWGLPLQAFESVHLKPSEVQHSPRPKSPFPASADCVSGAQSRVKFSSVVEDLSQPVPRKKGIWKEAFLASTGPVLAPSPACEETQKAMGGTQPDCDHGPSQAPLTEREGRLPSQSLTLGLMGRAPQIANAVGVEERSVEPSSGSTVAKNRPRQEIKGHVSRHPCHRLASVEMNLGSQASRAEEAREAVEAKEASVWEVTVGPSVPVSSQTVSMELRRSGSPGPSKSSSPETKSAAQGPEQPCLKTKFELRGKAEADNQPQGHAMGMLLQDNHNDVVLQDCATGVLLQDSAASGFCQDSHANVPLAVDIVGSHRALSTCQREYTSKDILAPQGPYAPTLNGQNSQRQQEPRIPKVKDPHESQSNMSVPTGESGDNRRPSPRQQGEELAGLRTSQAGGMSHCPPVKGTGDTLGNKRFQLLLDKEEVFPENHFGKKKSHCPLSTLRWEYLNSHPEVKGPEDLLHKSQPVTPPIAQNRRDPGRSSPVLEDRPIVAQSLMRALGQLLVEKMGLCQGPHTLDLNQNKRFQAPVGGNSCYLRPLSSPEQKTVINEMACDYQAYSSGHTDPHKRRRAYDCNSKWTFPPREPGSLGRSCQRESRMAEASGHIHHYPTCLPKCVPSGEPGYPSHAFPGSNFLQEGRHIMQRETIFPSG